VCQLIEELSPLFAGLGQAQHPEVVGRAPGAARVDRREVVRERGRHAPALDHPPGRCVDHVPDRVRRPHSGEQVGDRLVVAIEGLVELDQIEDEAPVFFECVHGMQAIAGPKGTRATERPVSREATRSVLPRDGSQDRDSSIVPPASISRLTFST
jgi:hypothetical protein